MDPKGDDFSHENNELKVLILKLNQDKTMYEKKVQRRNQEISRLKELLKEKEDQIAKLTNVSPLYKSFVVEPQPEHKVRLEVLESIILQHKSLVTTETMSAEKVLQKYIEKLRVAHDEDKVKQLEREISKLQDQARLDTNYSNKRIHQLEEGFFRQKKELETQLQTQTQANETLQSRLTQLVTRLAAYERSLSEINQSFVQNEFIRGQILLQYQKLQNKYQQCKKAADLVKQGSANSQEGESSKSKEKATASEIDMMMQNIQKNTAQRLLRKQQ